MNKEKSLKFRLNNLAGLLALVLALGGVRLPLALAEEGVPPSIEGVWKASSFVCREGTFRENREPNVVLTLGTSSFKLEGNGSTQVGNYKVISVNGDELKVGIWDEGIDPSSDPDLNSMKGAQSLIFRNDELLVYVVPTSDSSGAHCGAGVSSFVLLKYTRVPQEKK